MASVTGKLILMIFALKLIRANAMLYKVRDFVNAGILKSIYHALFELHIHYACTICMGTESVHNQSTFYTSKEGITTDSF